MASSPRAEPADFAFLIHPLRRWHRRILGVRRGNPTLTIGGPAFIESVGVIGDVWLPTADGPARGLVVGVPDVAGDLAADQQRAFAYQVRAARIAVEHGVRAIGLANALGVVAGRGSALAEVVDVPITPGHAATSWAATEITLKVLRQTGGPVGVLGFKGTVGDAVAAGLSDAGHRVLVDASGAAAVRRARQLGCEPVPVAELAAVARVIVGASTTGPVLDPVLVRGRTTLVDLALPPTLQPGRRRPDLSVVAGEALTLPGRVRADFWGRIWLWMAQYGRGCVFACLAEPMAMARTGAQDFSAGRKLDLLKVRELGRVLVELGYQPVVRAR